MKPRICITEGCNKTPRKSDGRRCYICRNRFTRHGDYNISPNWTVLKKGQPCLTKLGYIRINVDGKRVLQHRHIMEQHLRRKLKPPERIHHINGDRTDNRIENLELFSNHSDHQKNRHKYSWKKRKDIHKYTAEEITEIIKCLKIPHIKNDPKNKSNNKCFCGRPTKTRNLCARHYCWANKHKFT